MMPRVQVLVALKTFLDAGISNATVRHHRHRESTEAEWPCIAIRFVAENPQSFGASDEAPSIAEQVVNLEVDLIADCAIAPEVMAGDLVGTDSDPTGIGTASALIEQCLNLLFTTGLMPETLGGLLWNISYDGTGEDDGVSTPDQVRLVERLTLQFRVRAEAPMVILTGV